MFEPKSEIARTNLYKIQNSEGVGTNGVDASDQRVMP